MPKTLFFPPPTTVSGLSPSIVPVPVDLEFGVDNNFFCMCVCVNYCSSKSEVAGETKFQCPTFLEFRSVESHKFGK